MYKSNQDMLDSLSYAFDYIEKNKDKSKPLLTIELQDESSVPKVIYKGEEIKCKRNIYLNWDTDTLDIGGLTYAIEHVEKGNDHLTINRIERRVKGHASD